MGGKRHHGDRSCYNCQEQRAPSKARRLTFLEGHTEPELQAPEGENRAEYSKPLKISTKLLPISNPFTEMMALTATDAQQCMQPRTTIARQVKRNRR